MARAPKVPHAHQRVIGLPVYPQFDRHVILTKDRVVSTTRGAWPASRRVFGPPAEVSK